MSAPKWTKQQRDAITSPKRALLVSAAAGSGKTTVLADRCVWLVYDASEPCDVDQLLVVTFTRAAAGEMRSRITARLRDRAAESNDPRIEQQLRIVDRASISTLDSFCANLVREHFVAANVDPNFTIIDQDEARLLRFEAGKATLDSFFKSNRESDLHQLLRIHFNHDESELISSMAHIHDVLTSVVDPQGWLDHQLARLTDAKGINDSISDFYAILRPDLQSFAVEARQIGQLAQTDSQLSKHAQLAFELAMFAEELSQLLARREFDSAIRLVAKPPTANFQGAGRKADAMIKERVMKRLKPLREAADEGGFIWKIFKFTPADLRASVAEITPRFCLFIDLVRDFESRYTAAKRAVSSLDFADLNRAALKLLQSPDDPSQPSQLARALHRQFQHVLVDECQDNNPLQDEILRLVSTESISQKSSDCVSNLFSVGDVKQSIYGFRLANPKQFVERSRQLSELEKTNPERGALILLRENFRARGKLLGAINHVFERLMTSESAGIDYDESHALLEGEKHHEFTDGFVGRPIEFHVIESEGKDQKNDSHDDTDDIDDLDASETEAQLIANRIHQLMGELDQKRAMVIDETDRTKVTPRPIELGDIAILLRSARGLAGALAGDLRSRGVPVHLESASGFFDSIEIRDVLSLLQVADNSTRDIALAALMRSPLSRISDPESLMARLRIASPKIPFHQCVHSQKDSELLRDFFHQIDKWRVILRDERLDRAIELIVDEAGYLNWLSGLRDGAQRIANVQELIRRARTFSSFERQGVSRFIQFLRELEDEKDLDLPTATSQSRDVVRIMTVHKSKGLEFPVVIVPDLGRRRNTQSLNAPVLIDRQAGLGIKAYDAERHVRYPSLFYRLAERAIDQQHVAEELRILYVALTRAKEHLILIGTGGKVETWRDEWSDHTGALPASKIRKAPSMLQRLGPVAVMIERDAPNNIQIIPHSSSEIASLKPGRSYTTIPDSLKPLARFDPIDMPKTPSTQVDAVNKLNRPYKFEPLTTIAAAQAVTQVKQSLGVAQPIRLAQPRFTSKQSTVTAADRGIATHTAFQHIDYHKMNSVGEIRAQIQRLVDRKILLEHEVDAIDVESMLWFATTDLCQAMASPNVKLLRETPVYIAQPREPLGSPMEQILLRGRIDVAMIEPDGTATVIDFKTDRIDKADIAGRVDLYQSQMDDYRDALTRMLNSKARTKLVFLVPKQVVDV